MTPSAKRFILEQTNTNRIMRTDTLPPARSPTAEPANYADRTLTPYFAFDPHRHKVRKLPRLVKNWALGRDSR